jgi:hypothetical protein
MATSTIKVDGEAVLDQAMSSLDNSYGPAVLKGAREFVV